MPTVDHGSCHVWAKTPHGRIRCAYMGCIAKPSPDDVKRLGLG